MKKLIILLFLIVFGIVVYSQDNLLKSNDSIVIWNESRKLFWEDFKSLKNHSSKNHSATSAVGLLLFYSVEKDVIKFVVYSKFERLKSHVNFKTDYLLKHEQLHFDIVELYARKLRKQFLLLRNNKEVILDDYFLVYKKLKKELSEFQKLYDNQTLHSKDKIKQKEWDKKVLDEIKEFELYSYNNYLDSINW